jgi:hypothetical protein
MFDCLEVRIVEITCKMLRVAQALGGVLAFDKVVLC